MPYSKTSILRFVSANGEKTNVVPDRYWQAADKSSPDIVSYLAETRHSLSDVVRLETDLDAFYEAIRQFPDNMSWIAMDGYMTWRGTPFYFVENEVITTQERQSRYDEAVARHNASSDDCAGLGASRPTRRTR